MGELEVVDLGRYDALEARIKDLDTAVERCRKDILQANNRLVDKGASIERQRIRIDHLEKAMGQVCGNDIPILTERNRINAEKIEAVSDLADKNRYDLDVTAGNLLDLEEELDEQSPEGKDARIVQLEGQLESAKLLFRKLGEVFGGLA